MQPDQNSVSFRTFPNHRIICNQFCGWGFFYREQPFFIILNEPFFIVKHLVLCYIEKKLNEFCSVKNIFRHLFNLSRLLLFVLSTSHAMKVFAFKICWRPILSTQIVRSERKNPYNGRKTEITQFSSAKCEKWEKRG